MSHKLMSHKLFALVGLTLLLGACSTPEKSNQFLDTTAVGDVKLYLDCSFSGKSVSLDAGNYNYNDLTALGMPNDNVSSVRVADGYQVELFLDANYQGRSLTLTGDDNCLVDNNFNDLTSSIRVTRTGNPTTNLPTSDRPDFGPNVKIYDDSTPDSAIQRDLDAAFKPAALKPDRAVRQSARHLFVQTGDVQRLCQSGVLHVSSRIR